MSEWLKNLPIIGAFIVTAVSAFVAWKRMKPEAQNLYIDGAKSAVDIATDVMEQLKGELDRRDKDCEKRITLVETHNRNCEARVAMLESDGRKMRTALVNAQIPYEH